MPGKSIFISIAFIILFLLAAVLLIFIIVKCGRSMYRWKKTLNKEPDFQSATILRKNKGDILNNPPERIRAELEMLPEYSVTFLLEDGSERTVRVESALYHAIAEGDKGSVWLDGDTLLEFKRTKE